MGSVWNALMGGNSKWDADVKTDKRQHRNDILGFRTSSRPNHEDKKEKEDFRRQNRKDKKAAKKKWWQ
jgi:hypothetical protein